MWDRFFENKVACREFTRSFLKSTTREERDYFENDRSSLGFGNE